MSLLKKNKKFITKLIKCFLIEYFNFSWYLIKKQKVLAI